MTLEEIVRKRPAPFTLTASVSALAPRERPTSELASLYNARYRATGGDAVDSPGGSLGDLQPFLD